MVKVKVWGTRGSFPNVSEDCLNFGGNTTCFSMDNGKATIVLDAGTGIVRMGQYMSHNETHFPIHIFLSHVHLDHIQGLFFFPLLHDRDAKIHIYGEIREGLSVRQQISRIICPPYWPVRLEDCMADIRWHDIQPGGVYKLEEDVAVWVFRARHPDQGNLFGISMSGKTLFYGLDSEMDHMLQDTILEWARAHGCDLMVCDAFYTPSEYEVSQGWGHGSWMDGVKLAKICSAKRLLCSHHGWERTDQQILRMEKAAQTQMAQVTFAREGEEIVL